MDAECKAQDNSVSSSNPAISNGSEVLGSVTDSEGGVQLRTSARVSKKLKLDSLAQASVEKKDHNHEEEKKAEAVPTVEGKPRSKRVDWSAEDKFAFFEALNEFGKDIDAIHNYLVHKAKRRGGQETKTKDQVRFFYYRMWSILSKHITFPSYIKKQTQELYALINFGELRKKISLSNKKHYEKLSEMIYSGSTQLKFRGKVRKVRTPLCKALRKLNQIQESSEELRLPSCVTVELRPRHNEDWCRVQALAQNPRVRSVLPLHRRLETLLAYLTKRWQTPDSRLRQQLEGEGEAGGGGGGGAAGGAPPGDVRQPCHRAAQRGGDQRQAESRRVRAALPPGEQAGAAAAAAGSQLPVIHRSKGRGVKRARTDSVSAREVEEGGGSGGGESEATDHTDPTSQLSLDCVSDNAQPDIISPRANGEVTSSSPVPDGSSQCLHSADLPASWALSTAGATRIGDLYIMFGCDAKIHLDYWWERSPDPVATAAVATDTATETSSATATEAEAETGTATGGNVATGSDSLAVTLRKLLSVAKLDATKPKASTSSNIGCDSQASKSRPSKPKAQDNAQKVEAQLKFEVCPLTLDEVFRRPIVKPNETTAITAGIDKMRPRYCNRRGRPRRPPPAPPRLAPLLPKVPPMSLFNSVTKPSSTGFKPIAPAPSPTTAPTPVSIDVKVAPVALVAATPVPVPAPAPTERGPSPPSLSNLLDDLSLPSLTGSNSQSSRLSTPVPSFTGLLDNNEGIETKDQWITSDVADLSLSGFSFLNNLDTDIKDLGNESRMSDVDSQLGNLMATDNSTDLNAIIADLTATITPEKTEPD